MRNKKLATVFGAILFLITVSLIVSIALSVYVAVGKRSDTRGVVSAVMLLTIFLLSLVATLIDLIRRKISVDRPVELILSATDKIA